MGKAKKVLGLGSRLCRIVERELELEGEWRFRGPSYA